MNVHIGRATLLLGECDILSLENAAGSVVSVRAGSVWITQELDGTDHVLRAGDRFRIDRGGRTVLQAFGEAEVSVRRGDGAPDAARAGDRVPDDLDACACFGGRPRTVSPLLARSFRGS